MPGFEPRVFFEKNAGNEGPTRSCLTNCTTGDRASVQFLPQRPAPADRKSAAR